MSGKVEISGFERAADEAVRSPRFYGFFGDPGFGITIGLRSGTIAAPPLGPA